MSVSIEEEPFFNIISFSGYSVQVSKSPFLLLFRVEAFYKTAAAAAYTLTDGF